MSRRNVVQLAGRAGLYFLVPALSAVAPLMAVPVISVKFGPSGWASVAIALSLGTTVAVLAELGYGVTGPQDVARNVDRSPLLYQESLAARLVALAVLMPPAAIASFLLGGVHAVAAALVAAGTALGSLTASWYFIGLGRPGLVLKSDTAPRLVGVACASVLMLLGAPLECYGALLLLSGTVSVIIATRLAGQPLRLPASAWSAVPTRLRQQGVVVVGRGVSTLYTSLPTAIVGLHGAALAGLFSAVDRPARMGYTILGGVTDRLQSWVGGADPTQSAARRRATVLINLAMGLVAGAFYAALGPVIAQVLFASAFAVTWTLSSLAGLCVALMCFSRGLGLVVVSVERAASLTSAVLAGALVGVAGMLLLVGPLGVAGALIAIGAAEIAGIMVQGIVLWRHFGVESSDDVPPASPPTSRRRHGGAVVQRPGVVEV